MQYGEKMSLKWLLAATLVSFLATTGTAAIHVAKAATVRNFTLYGSYVQGGWGFNQTSISSPGPTIIVEQGDTVNLTLVSKDGVIHRFFVSYTNASSINTGDPESFDFSSTVNYEFVATDTVGTYTYRCSYHPTVMWGYFKVVITGGIPEFPAIALLSLLVVGTTSVALVSKRKRQG
jgi:FtsP/CotA-like multicopper oxidase with cupredoxin domain